MEIDMESSIIHCYGRSDVVGTEDFYKSTFIECPGSSRRKRSFQCRMCVHSCEYPSRSKRHFLERHWKRSVKFGNYVCFPCSIDHKDGTTRNAHFHCPVCGKTCWRNRFQPHLKRHTAQRNDGGSNQDPLNEEVKKSASGNQEYAEFPITGEHFREKDHRLQSNGRHFLKYGAGPSIFGWTKSPPSKNVLHPSAGNCDLLLTEEDAIMSGNEEMLQDDTLPSRNLLEMSQDTCLKNARTGRAIVCCVTGCKSSKNTGHRMYLVPSGKERYMGKSTKEWACSFHEALTKYRSDPKYWMALLTKKTLICEKHFEESEILKSGPHSCLRFGAIPTLFPRVKKNSGRGVVVILQDSEITQDDKPPDVNAKHERGCCLPDCDATGADLCSIPGLHGTRMGKSTRQWAEEFHEVIYRYRRDEQLKRELESGEAKICSRHFEESDICMTGSRPYIKSRVIPTLNLTDSSQSAETYSQPAEIYSQSIEIDNEQPTVEHTITKYEAPKISQISTIGDILSSLSESAIRDWRFHQINPQSVHLTHYKDELLHATPSISLLISQVEGDFKFSVAFNGVYAPKLAASLEFGSGTLENMMAYFIKVRVCVGYDAVPEESLWDGRMIHKLEQSEIIYEKRYFSKECEVAFDGNNNVCHTCMQFYIKCVEVISLEIITDKESSGQ